MRTFTVTACGVLLVALMVDVAVCAETSTSGAAQEAAAMTTGEIRKIDVESGKLTIRHAPIVNLDMAAMTMAFRVKEGINLSAWRAGDKIRFIAERVNGSLMVTYIELAE